MSRRSRLVEPTVPAAVVPEVVLAAGSPEALRVAALAEVEVTDATSPVEVLGARVEAELDRCAGMLFTATPREDLVEVARWQRLADEAWAGQVRHVVAATSRMSWAEREFAGDEMALALGISPDAGRVLVFGSLRVASLPGLVDAVEAGRLSQAHVRACVRVLDEHAGGLTLEQQQAVVLIALARYSDQTPGEWARLVRKLVISLDPRGAAERKEAASAERRVSFYPLPDEQGGLTLQAPLEQVAAVQARIDAEAKRLKVGGDERTLEQLRCDVSLQLLTSGRLDGQDPAPWSVAVIVPLSTVEGGDLEVAEIPGWGPVLPSTGRDLAAQAQSYTQVAVDAEGQVLAVSDPQPVPAGEPEPPAALRHLAVAARKKPVLRDLGCAFLPRPVPPAPVPGGPRPDVRVPRLLPPRGVHRQGPRHPLAPRAHRSRQPPLPLPTPSPREAEPRLHRPPTTRRHHPVDRPRPVVVHPPTTQLLAPP